MFFLIKTNTRAYKCAWRNRFSPLVYAKFGASNEMDIWTLSCALRMKLLPNAILWRRWSERRDILMHNNVGSSIHINLFTQTARPSFRLTSMVTARLQWLQCNIVTAALDKITHWIISHCKFRLSLRESWFQIMLAYQGFIFSCRVTSAKETILYDFIPVNKW